MAKEKGTAYNPPPQLSEAKLVELVTKLRAGIATEDDVEEIAKGHIGLAMHVASKYVRYAPKLRDILMSEAFFGIAVALSRAAEKLRDNNITPFIVSYVRKYVFLTLTEDKLVPVPYTTIRDRHRRGLRTSLPKIVSNEALLPAKPQGSLMELRETIASCIRDNFEREVIELRELGMTDEEVSVKLNCSRPKVTLARQAVHSRFIQK